ncbi:MAG: DUF4350 domain-containing protein [bacterium]
MKVLAKINPLIWLGSLLALLALVALATQLEKKEITENTGLKGEAFVNPLYAHRLFLKRMGIPATTIKSSLALDELPNTNTVIYLYTSRTTLSKRRVHALLAWVKRGGHLITIANHYDPNWLEKLGDGEKEKDKENIAPSHYNDILQQELGIRIGEFVVLDDDKADNPAVPASKTESSQDASWHIQWEDQTFAIQPDFFYELHSDYDDEFVNLNDHPFIANVKLDDGLVTLASHLEFLEKEGLGDFDHAELFFRIITKHHENPENVWLIHQGDAPSLLTLLWKNAPLFIMSFLLLVGISLWYQSQQFGPLLTVPPLKRRRLMEHINASGHHLWQYDRQILLKSTRQAFFHHIARYYPTWHHLSQKEKIDYINEQWQSVIDNQTTVNNKNKSNEKLRPYTKEEMNHILFENFELTPDNFTKTIQDLQVLMKFL